MARMHQIALTGLELQGLWVRLTDGSTKDDTVLDEAAERAVDKLWRAKEGMKMKAHPEPAGGRKAGAPLPFRLGKFDPHKDGA